MSQASGGCACGRIDVHAHFLPDFYLEALRKAGLTTVDGGMPVPAWSETAALEVMDRQGIATAMISLSSPSTHFLPPAQRAGLIRQVNEAGRGLMTAHPQRFGFFATLPLHDVEAALREVDHVFETLGVDGVILESNIDGEYLGSPRFAPVFDALDRRGAVVFLHPTSPACLDALGLGRPAPLLEFPLDSTRTVVDLIYNRTLQTRPGIKLIVPHGGAALPVLAARIAAFANLPFITPRPVSDQEAFEALQNLYYDVALSTHPITLGALRALTPLSHILFGSDWPFTPEFALARNIQQLSEANGLSQDDIEAIARENAERIFPRLRAHRAA